MNSNFMRITLFVLLGCFVVVTCSQPKPENVIVAENKLPGTTDWLISVKFDTCSLPDHRFCRRPQVEGYCSKTSVATGDTIDFFVSTNPASKFSLNIYRMGYYQGKGGSLKKSIPELQGMQQAEPQPDPKTNFFESKWNKSYSLVVPEDWVSGVYVCKLTTIPEKFQSYMVFTVRDNRKADFLFQSADLTWQSYNRWPQWHSMYDEGHKPWVNTNGAKVSFDRPYGIYINELPSGFNPLSNGSGEFLLWEFPLSFWMEREGYDVTYITNVDVHAISSTLLRAKAFLSVGHDEYWTYDMYNHVADARDKGLSLIFLSGNTMDGIQYLEASTDGRPNRTMGRMPEREYKNEQDLMGSTSWGVGYGSFVCTAPDHWVYQNTGMKKGDSIPELIGWEYNGRPVSDKHKVEIVAETHPDPLGFGQGDENHVATVYYGPKGNFVFNAGTCWWPLFVAKTPAYQHPHKLRQELDFSKPDERVQQITRNLLNRAIKQTN
ncbi:MAG: hypothetical protein JNK79_06410 [Chitinophagaceae bacterium]|nr:hypothetical protein [Chitinophagaceae bacterium]